MVNLGDSLGQKAQANNQDKQCCYQHCKKVYFYSYNFK